MESKQSANNASIEPKALPTLSLFRHFVVLLNSIAYEIVWINATIKLQGYTSKTNTKWYDVLNPEPELSFIPNLSTK